MISLRRAEARHHDPDPAASLCGRARAARDQRRVSAAERRGGLWLVASPYARSGSLQLHHDTWIQRAFVDPRASSEPDLESRIRLRRAELFVRLRELRGDSRFEAAEARDKVKAKLSELAHLLKWGISDGWGASVAP